MLRFVFTVLLVASHNVDLALAKDDDAVIVDSAHQTGPGPSLLGSMDNIFSAVKRFDQYECLERMLCEYMQQPADPEALPGDNLIQSFLGINSDESSSNFGNSGATRFVPPPQQTTFSRPLVDPNNFQTTPLFAPRPQFPPQFGPRPQFPPQFGSRPPVRGSFVPPPPPTSINRPSSFFGRRIGHRARRSIQGNIIRLFQATGMDTSNMYPYIRAALIGHATREDPGSASFTRGTRRSTCTELYSKCPSDSASIVNYLNNHNGGLVNHVEPSVQQEVVPLVSAIINEAVGGEDDASTTVSPAFASADTLLTSMLVQGVANYFGGNTDSGGILGGSNSGTSSILSSFTSLLGR